MTPDDAMLRGAKGEWTVNDSTSGSSGGWGNRHGGLALVGATIVGAGLGLHFDDFVPLLLTGFGAGLALFGFIGILGTKR